MAFCIWDGGHLATYDEIVKTWINDKNPTGYPWTFRAPTVGIVTGPDPNAPGFGVPQGTDSEGRDARDYIAHEFGPFALAFDEVNAPFSYWWPPQDEAPLFQRHIANIPAPGRKPLGNGSYGHSDIIGSWQLVLAGKPTPTDPFGKGGAHPGSTFEIHEVPTAPRPAPFALPPYWAYWGAGGRCAREPMRK